MKKIVILAAALVLAIGGTASACLPGEQEDKCKNLDGIQSEVPAGYEEKDGTCTELKEPEQPVGDVEVQPETKTESKTETKTEEQPVVEQPEVTTATTSKPVEQPAPAPAPAPAPQPVQEEFVGK